MGSFSNTSSSRDLISKIRQIRKLKHNIKRLAVASDPYPISDDIRDYIITKYSYSRQGSFERKYVDCYKNLILSLFNNSCAICSSARSLDLDHWLVAKSLGGVFCLEHKRGYLVNNMIPLCGTCNRRKGKKSYKLFCNPQQAQKIADVNKSMTRKVNQDARSGKYDFLHISADILLCELT